MTGRPPRTRTTPAIAVPRPGPGIGPGLALALVAVASSVAFAVVRPPVPDLWAARAREYAARHGVGVTYWFPWFGGTVPGHYSVLAPFVSRAIGSMALVCVTAVICTVLLRPLARGVRYEPVVLAAGALAVACNLWSGRVAFVAGSMLALGVVLLVRTPQPAPAAVLTFVATLVTPVTAAFLAFGLVGVAVFDRRRRATAVTVIVTCGVALGAVALLFGSPGPEGFRGRDMITALAGTAVLLLLRPERRIALITVLALPTVLAVGLIGNGLGSNFQRMVWFVLPVACLASARTKHAALLVVAALPLGLGVAQTVRDLSTAASPLSASTYYAGLARRLDHTAGLEQYRVEVVPNGTHTDSYELLGHAQLARGYETQSDKAYDSVLTHAPLSAGTLRGWLDDNAIGYVVLSRATLRRGSPEDVLVRDHRPSFLRPVWSDADVELYAVAHPTPIAPPPARVLAVSQATMRLRLPPGATTVRVRWSRWLALDGAPGARLDRSAGGWTQVRIARACTCTLTG